MLEPFIVSPAFESNQCNVLCFTNKPLPITPYLSTVFYSLDYVVDHSLCH